MSQCRLEDGEVMNRSDSHSKEGISTEPPEHKSEHKTGIGTLSCRGEGDCEKKDYVKFWKDLESEFNVSVPVGFRDAVWGRVVNLQVSRL